MITVEGFKVIATGLGYTYAGNCNCNGFKTDKFKKEDYLLYIRTRSGKLSLKKYGVTVIPFSDVETFFKAFEREEKGYEISSEGKIRYTH